MNLPNFTKIITADSPVDARTALVIHHAAELTHTEWCDGQAFPQLELPAAAADRYEVDPLWAETFNRTFRAIARQLERGQLAARTAAEAQALILVLERAQILIDSGEFDQVDHDDPQWVPTLNPVALAYQYLPGDAADLHTPSPDTDPADTPLEAWFDTYEPTNLDLDYADDQRSVLADIGR